MSNFNIEDYEEIIKSQQSVLFLMGPPGMGKTAIPEYIAKKNNWQYIDLRLANRDSSEVIGIPQTFIKLKDGNSLPINAISSLKMSLTTEDMSSNFIRYTPPEWAVLANERPTLIAFEELNRAPLEVRNAALQILLERRVGESFHLNENVFFVATGNLGEEDGCEVEELDRATKGRLYKVLHDIPPEEWEKHYAKDNVNKYIVDFVKCFPEHRFKTYDNLDSYASYRSWTFLSNFIGKDETDVDTIIRKTSKFGFAWVGHSMRNFMSYLEKRRKVTIKDILNRFSEVKENLDDIPKDQINELIENLKKYNFSKVTQKQIKNVIGFMKVLFDDQRFGFYSYILNDLCEARVIEQEGDDKADKEPEIEIYFKTQQIEKFVKSIKDEFKDELSELDKKDIF